MELSDKWHEKLSVEEDDDTQIKQLYEMTGQQNAIDRSIILLYLTGKPTTK